MPKLVVDRDGMYRCKKCGGSHFTSKEDVIRCFKCRYCKYFQRDGLKIIDKRKKVKTKKVELGRFVEDA